MYKIYFWYKPEQVTEVINDHKPEEDFSSGGRKPCDARVAAEQTWPSNADGDHRPIAAPS